MHKNIYTQVIPYTKAKPNRRFVELTLTLFATAILIISAYFTFNYNVLLAIPFIILIGLFLVRCFIIQHDCSHGALFEKKLANQWLGRVLSLLTFTPFAFWKWGHLVHHRCNGNLDQRGIGDIYMLTVQEYSNARTFQKLLYWLSRHPIVMLLILAPLYFLCILRFNFKYYRKVPGYQKSATYSIYLTNISLILFYSALCYLFGYQFLVIILLPAFLLAAIIGTWLFYVQHNFPDSHFARDDKWGHLTASLSGSSYYQLPSILEWLTGYIGYHHIHHFNPKIPFYRLREVFLEINALQSPKTYGVKDTFKLAQLFLYDENIHRFITWRQYQRKSN